MSKITSTETALNDQELAHTKTLLANNRALNLWVSGLLSGIGILLSILIQDGTALFFVVVAGIVYLISIPKTIALRLDIKYKIKIITPARITYTSEYGTRQYFANFDGKTKEFEVHGDVQYAQDEVVLIEILKYSKEVIRVKTEGA